LQRQQGFLEDTRRRKQDMQPVRTQKKKIGFIAIIGDYAGTNTKTSVKLYRYIRISSRVYPN